MTTWNDIPFDSNAEPEVKADEFEKQWEENGGNNPPEDNNPYSKGNFSK